MCELSKQLIGATLPLIGTFAMHLIHTTSLFSSAMTFTVTTASDRQLTTLPRWHVTPGFSVSFCFCPVHQNLYLKIQYEVLLLIGSVCLLLIICKTGTVLWCHKLPKVICRLDKGQVREKIGNRPSRYLYLSKSRCAFMYLSTVTSKHS